ncbi:hypothetical protein WNY61_20170 [Sulfitobacter sp. AS92]|uniref:hypothetical protein n=1 Tax=Sulfitobacter sp. AS92 TaxID=3135783 RepID=UPI003176CFBC
MNITMQISALLLSLLPEGFTPVGEAQVEVDGRAAILSRAERSDGTNRGIGGEHVSTVVSEDGILLGFTRMTREMAASAELPSDDVARDIAMDFLDRHAPDLLDAHKVHWIAPHNETITVNRQGNVEKITLTGMKVKMRSTNSDRLWFWVIVGPDEEVMVFERDIFWVNMPGHRRTEHWLQDSWLLQQDRPEVKELETAGNG